MAQLKHHDMIHFIALSNNWHLGSRGWFINLSLGRYLRITVKMKKGSWKWTCIVRRHSLSRSWNWLRKGSYLPPGIYTMSKTNSRLNEAIWLEFSSHMTSLSQSKCFISQEWSHAEIYLWNQLWVGKLLGKSWPQCKRMKQDV